MSPWDRCSHTTKASSNLGGLLTGRAPRAGRGVGVVHMYMSGGNNEGLIVLREQGLHKRLGCLRWGYAPGCMTATILTIA